jgi:hypothetical protein
MREHRRGQAPGPEVFDFGIYAGRIPPGATHGLTQRPRAPSEGDVLVICDDLTLVFDLRQALLDHGLNVTWTNNFWVAMSHLETSRFSSLILDMKVESVEEDFVHHFVEEYDRLSTGRKIFLGAERGSAAFRRRLHEQGCLVWTQMPSAKDLSQALLGRPGVRNGECGMGGPEPGAPGENSRSG